MQNESKGHLAITTGGTLNRAALQWKGLIRISPSHLHKLTDLPLEYTKLNLLNKLNLKLRSKVSSGRDKRFLFIATHLMKSFLIISNRYLILLMPFFNYYFL